ncbi:ferric iron reductase protein FhuF [Paenibacillus harenae]|nr:ferric iron reductase protein FhuF [Paenibacillus harenae]
MDEAIVALLDEEFNLAVHDKPSILFSCDATELLNEYKMKQVLERYTPLVKGKDISVGEIYMAGWFRGPMLGMLYMLSAWNRTLDLSLENIQFQVHEAVYQDRKYVSCGLKLKNADWISGPEDEEEQETWITQSLGDYFAHTVRPIYETIERAGTLKSSMLWGQLPTSLAYGYDRLMDSDECESVKRKAEGNFKLAKELDPALFGRSKNPLAVPFRMTESLQDPNKQVRMKSSCCLYYLVDGGYYCFTCPRMKESERDSRREAYRLEKQEQV